MTDLVDPAKIEEIVGATRHAERHLARAVSAEQTVYILHSRRCLESSIDLRFCPYSRALDNGIVLAEWRAHEDEPGVPVAVIEDRLVPLGAPGPEVPC